MITTNKKSGYYRPKNIYIREKVIPYSYYQPQTQPNFQIITTNDDNKSLIPHIYILPLVLIGTLLLFSFLTVGLLAILNRTFATPVVRARLKNLTNQSNLLIFEEILKKSIEIYAQQLNNNN